MSLLSFTTASPTDTHLKLHWAPYTIQEPYIVFLNDFVFPSWKTKHLPSRLILPLGVPFAAVCGVCYWQSSKLPGNIRVDGDPEFISIQLPTNNSADVFRHTVDISCRMSYIQTQPLYNSGKLSCHLDWNRQTFTETVTFDVKRVKKTKTKEELTIHGTSVNIQCPGIKSLLARDNPLVFVWHTLPETNLQSMTYPTRANLTLGIRQDETITCSAYNIFNPFLVLQKTYHIRHDRPPNVALMIFVSVTGFSFIAATAAICFILASRRWNDPTS